MPIGATQRTASSRTFFHSEASSRTSRTLRLVGQQPVGAHHQRISWLVETASDDDFHIPADLRLGQRIAA